MVVTPVASETVVDQEYDLPQQETNPEQAPKEAAAADAKSLPTFTAQLPAAMPPTSPGIEKSESPADVIARRLAPPSTSAPSPRPSEANSDWLGSIAGPSWSGATAGIGLAVVVGLLMVCTLMMRRGGAKSSGVLPAEAFAILGRAPLVGQSYAQLIRVGNKLVLVAMTPSGLQPLTEVTDPVEVGRLIGLCSSSQSHGPSAEFQQVLASLAREPARGFLGGEAKPAGRRAV
jgi:flagellar protein FliO/FliZ